MPSCPWDYALDIRERVAAYIELQEKMLGQFQAADSCVYQYRLAAAEETDSSSVYRSYEDCLAAVIHAAQATGCCKLEIRKEPLNAAEEETVGLRIFKRPMDPGEDSPREDYCILTLQGEVYQLECRALSDRDLDLSLAFDGMWFDFPAPFHAGCIVCSHSKPDEPFVLTGLCTWDAETLRQELPISGYSNKWLSNLDRTLARMRSKGDVSDMTCSGYTMSGNPGEAIPFVFNDHLLDNYLDLEYYRGPLKDIHKLLKPISDFLKAIAALNFC